MNLTDKETIKALGCCINKYNSCESCPLLEYGDSKACQDKLQIDTLDLINRQKAEIEAVTQKLRAAVDTIESMNKSIGERDAALVRMPEVEYPVCTLVKNGEIFTKTSEDYDKLLQDISAEAIKGFAERLCEGRVSNDPVVIAVKVELKMAGENVEENSSF